MRRSVGGWGHDVAMSADWGMVSGLASELATVGIAAWTGALFGSRELLGQERRAVRTTASKSLAGSVGELRRLLRSHGLVPVTPAEVGEAFLAFSTVLQEHDHRLPAGWAHLGRSVRDAAGTVFGGIAPADIRPDTLVEPLGSPGSMWQDFGAEYLEYVHLRLRRWGDSQRRSGERLLTYEEWLVATGRREPIGQNGGPRMLDA